MNRPAPAETKLLMWVVHPFTLWRPPAEMAEQIRRRWPGMKVCHQPETDRLLEELADTHIFVGYSLRPAQFRHATQLQWIHCTAAGVLQLMYPEMQSRGVIITNARGVHAIPMAEHILGMLLAMARRFPSAFRYQQQRRWAQQEIWDEPVRPRELWDQLLLVVGLGAIGRELARRAKALGIRVWGVTRSGNGPSDLAERIFPVGQLNQGLPLADYVVVAAPETAETHHLLGAQQFRLMKPTAYLVNVARGSLLDEAALIQALKERWIAGAALDVAEQEPLPSESPLWTLDNLFLTPHLSGASETLWKCQTELLIENLERWFSGKDLLNRVDPQQGY